METVAAYHLCDWQMHIAYASAADVSRYSSLAEHIINAVVERLMYDHLCASGSHINLTWHCIVSVQTGVPLPT